MKHSNFRRTRYYRVSASEYPIEKYLLSTGFQEAAEEYAALFDLGELFAEVNVTVSLCGAVGDWSVRSFRVGSTPIRVYEAVQLEEAGVAATDDLEELSDAELLEWEDLADGADAGADDEQTVVRLVAAEVAAAESSTDMTESELSDNQSSGLRRLAGTIVRGLFGRRRTSSEAA